MGVDDKTARAALAAAVLDSARATRKAAEALEESGRALEDAAKLLAGASSDEVREPPANGHRQRRFGGDVPPNIADTLRAFGEQVAKVADQVSRTIADK